MDDAEDGALTWRNDPTDGRRDFPEWLTLREQMFVVAFVGPALGRAVLAYELAGYKARGASGRANASRLLTKDRIRTAIEQLSAEGRARLQANGDEELALLGDVMRFSVLDLFDAEGRQIPIWKLPRHVAAAIKGIRPTKNGTVLEFRDTVHPAEVRLKVFGRLKETVKVERPLEEIIALSNQLQEERNATAAIGAISESSGDEGGD